MYESFIKLSSKGQITIPGYVRFLLRLAKGDRFKIEIIGEKIILTPDRLWNQGKSKVRQGPTR